MEHSLPWHAVHTQTGKELLAASLLERTLQVPVYLPEVLQKRRGEMRLAPLFPGYLFVQAAPGDVETTEIQRPGVIRLVTFGGRPRPVAASVIAALRARVNELNASGGLLPHPFHVGEPVRLKSGPLEGLEAVFMGPATPTRRVRVLLDFLGGAHAADVDVAWLEPLPKHPPRRTRGKGRWIGAAAAARADRRP